jgi:hypothetical protein
MAFQDRIILLLDDNPELEELKDIFESPLGLAKELVISCFKSDPHQGLLKYESELDSIKKRAAGITRAHDLSSYKIAEYSPYLFAFQQFFHSSYRARQGEVLEAVVYHSLRSGHANPSKEKKDRKSLIKTVFDIRKNVNYDVDFTATNRDRILLGQIRSTDVTGGTTAKGSLVDLLRFILREKRASPSARYLVVVWEPLERQQKQSLINKIWDSLRSELGSTHEREFKENIDRGWNIPDTNISIRLVYGIDEFGDELNNFSENTIAKSKLLSLWESIQNWDDLWLTYAIASLELENLICGGQTNFQVLQTKLSELRITISNDDLRNYKQSSISIAERIAREWTETTLPVTAPSDILNYLRDLVLLKMINVKVMGYDSSRSTSFNSFF